MEEFVKIAKDFALTEHEKTSMPLLKHIELSTSVGLRLAKELKANEKIVEVGTYLMDCMIGQALKEERLQEHVQMSKDKTSELLEKSKLSNKDKENMEHCVSEHHGVDKFYSIESEICCNADCYRFISVKGFTYALRYLQDMPFEDLINLLENKVEEKWKALTLDICKTELEPQYRLIKDFIKELKK